MKRKSEKLIEEKNDTLCEKEQNTKMTADLLLETRQAKRPWGSIFEECERTLSTWNSILFRNIFLKQRQNKEFKDV